MMFYQWSFLTVLFLQYLLIHSTPIHSKTSNSIIEPSDDEHQRAQNILMDFMKNILDDVNPHERAILINHLRQYLNRMCLMGHFGSSNADACQHVASVIHQSSETNEETSDTSNERHGLQKRFFCNGFIGCKSSSGRI